MDRDGWASRPSLLAAVGAAAFATVYLEVALMKLASVMFNPIFVYAMIGVALLGYGAAGTFVAVWGPAPAPAAAVERLARWMLAFAAVSLPAFLCVNAIDVPLATLLGTLPGLLLLVLLYALLTLPFVLAGVGMASVFGALAAHANRLYFADLVGAGAGGVLGVASLPVLGGTPLPAAAGAVAAAAAAWARAATGRRRRAALVLGAANLAAVAILAGLRPVEVHTAPDKHGPVLARRACPGGLAVPFSRWSLFGRVDVTEPFATLPPQFGGDVSPTFGALRIEQRMMTIDGEAPAFLYRVPDGPASLGFLAGTSQSPAYRLRPAPHVLVVGVGGATDVLLALGLGARRVTAVELNPVNAAIVRDVYADYIGRVVADPRVALHVAEGRNFVARDRAAYDVIQLSGVDTGAAHGAYGLGTMPESYIYTVEAMRDFLARLAPGGVLSVTRDLHLGWAPRLTAVVRAALAARGLDPAPRLAVLQGKGWGWATILAKLDPFTPAEVASLREFAEAYDFPLLYDPLAPDGSVFARVVREGIAADGDFDLRPSTDDWPFFFMSLRWSRLPAILRRLEQPFANPLAFLLVSMVGLSAAAVVLVLWPLRRLGGGWRATGGTSAIAAYFALLGAAFMLVEIGLMQRFTVFLGNPVLAVATVLAALLVSSGLGSWSTRARRGDVVRPALAVVVGLLLVFGSPLLRDLLPRLLWLPLGARLGLVVALVALLGFPMGMPFPAGIARVGARAPTLVPWAWGINGMLSVWASLSSYLVGMVVGYTAMFLAGALLYGAALVLAPRAPAAAGA
jgi:hypothetical protein